MSLATPDPSAKPTSMSAPHAPVRTQANVPIPSMTTSALVPASGEERTVLEVSVSEYETDLSYFSMPPILFRAALNSESIASNRRIAFWKTIWEFKMKFQRSIFSLQIVM